MRKILIARQAVPLVIVTALLGGWGGGDREAVGDNTARRPPAPRVNPVQQKQSPETIRLMNARPSVVNVANVVEWSLTLNGVSFEGNEHRFPAMGTVHVLGHLKAKDGVIRPRTVPEFRIVLRPKGEATGKEWSALGARNAHLEVKAAIIDGKVDATADLNPDYMVPGEYEARLYFRTLDYLHAEFTADLIATSHVSIFQN